MKDYFINGSGDKFFKIGHLSFRSTFIGRSVDLMQSCSVDYNHCDSELLFA